MDRDQAIAIADDYVREVRRSQSYYDHKFLRAAIRADGTWSVAYQLFVPSNPDIRVFSALVLIVDPTSGRARPLGAPDPGSGEV